MPTCLSAGKHVALRASTAPLDRARHDLETVRTRCGARGPEVAANKHAAATHAAEQQPALKASVNHSAIMDAYQELGVARDASVDEIRHAYHRLARCHHPDSAGTSADADAFDRIQTAWDKLKESDARMNHDCHLRAHELADVQVGSRIDEVDLDDMDYAQDATGAGVWRYGCRCGDAFVLREDDLADGVEVLQCYSCSLCIRPLYCSTSA